MRGSIISPLMATRSNESWLFDLRAEGPARELALADLREVIDHGLPYALALAFTERPCLRSLG